jgi:hypothetical protein
MDSREMYSKLVDLNVGGELPAELEDELKAKALTDRDLSHDMATLTHAVGLLGTLEEPEFTEESFQRILMKLYAKTGVDVQPSVSAPSHMQYYLPIAG